MSDNFELGEEDQMNLCQAWPIQRNYVKSGTRVTEQVSICVYKHGRMNIEGRDR